MKHLLLIILVSMSATTVFGQWCSGDARIFIKVSKYKDADNFKIKNILENGEKGRRDFSVEMVEDSNSNIFYLMEYPNGCGLGTLSFDIVNTKTKETMHLDLKYLPEGYPTFRLPKFETGNYFLDYFELTKCVSETKDEQNKGHIYDCDNKKVKAIKTRFYFPEITILNLEEFQVEEIEEKN